jgi:ribosomal protein S18 acetylase RimI-like enzyme
MNMLIREFRDNDPVSDITMLLHRAYKPLSDAGLKFVASWQDDDRTLKRIKTGRCFLLINDKKIAGTITYYAPDKSRTDWPELYKQDKVAHFGQFAVDPSLQKQGMGNMLLDHLERFAISEGDDTIAFDTAETAYSLINYYRKRGYSFADYHQWNDTNYRSVLMKKSLTGIVVKEH